MAVTHNLTGSALALDVGDKRVGLAVASLAARLPRPLMTLERNDDFWTRLGEVIKSQAVSSVVIGLPRNLQGDQTAQTTASQNFADDFKRHFNDLAVDLQDEALTSRQAEAELRQRRQAYSRGDIDALAASYILADWLTEHPEPAA